jgi:outer membrane protein assembly factor BamA/autotransporter translocation and assembly factor TamB
MIGVVKRQWWLAAVVGVVLVTLAAFAVLHTPPVRARALDLLIARLAQAGIVARAERLDYNLATFDVRIHRLTLATPASSDTPFAAADEVRVVFGWGVLRGRIDIPRVEAVHPRVVLVRSDRGAVNWPTSEKPGGSSLGPLNFGLVSLPDLDVSWHDEQARLAVDVGGLALQLTPTVVGTGGTVRLSRPAAIQWTDRRTTLQTLDGRLSWNGRDLSLDGFHIVLPEGRLAIDGRMDRLLDGPGAVDLRIAADANLASLASWTQLEESINPVTGGVHVDAVIAGSLSAPTAALQINSRDIGVAGLQNVAVQASGRASTDAAALTTFEARVGGGTITGRGQAVLPGGAGELRLEWRQLDLATLMRQLLHDTPQLAARVDGALDARWSAPRADVLLIHGEARTAAADEPRGRAVPIDGTIAFDLQQQRWTLRADETLDRNVRATADLGGSLSHADLLRSSLSGGLHVLAPDVARLARTLTRLGLVSSSPAIAGVAQSDFALSGTIGDPRLEGTVASRLQYAGIGPASVRARATVTRTAVRLDEIDGRLGDSEARGGVRLAIDTSRLDGTLDLTLKNLDVLSKALPPAARPEGALDVHASLSGSLTTPRVDADVTSSGLTSAGQHVDRVEARVHVIGAAIAIERVRIDSGEGRLEGNGQMDLSRRTYVAHATATSFPIRPVPGDDGSVMAPVSTRLSGQLDGEGTFDRLDGRGRLLFADATWADANLGAIESDMTLRGRRVSLDVRVPDLQLTASGDVGIDANSSVSAHGRWEPADVAAIATRLGWSPPFPLSGSGLIRFDVSGPQARPEELHIAADLDRLNLDVDGNAVVLARPARMEYDARAIRVRDADLAVGGSHLTITGSLGDAAPEGLVATLQGSVGDFEFLEHLVRPTAADHTTLPPPAGSITLRIAASGSVSAPLLTGAFRLSDGRVPIVAQAAVTGANLTATYAQGVLTVDDLRAAFEGATLSAKGEVPADLFRDRLPARWRDLVPRSGRPASLTAQVSSITQQAAAPFVDAALLQSIAGHVDAAIDLRADGAAVDRVAGTIVLNRAELALSGVSFDQQTPTRLRVHDGRVDVETWIWGRGDNRVALTGGVSLGADRALALTAKTSLDLGLINAFTRAARAAGRADGDLRIGGTMAEPTVDGYLTFADGELRMSTPKLVVSDLTGTVTLNKDAITLERIYANVNGGESELGGTIHHRWFTPLDGQITLRARDAAVDLSGLRAEADVDLNFAIEQKSAALSGTVTVLRGAYREPLSLTTGLLQALRSPAAAAPVGGSSALDDIRLDVRIVTQDDLLVDNNYAQLAASADLRLIGTVAQPAATGRASLGEGGIVFFGGRRYRLDRQGSIDFANTTRIEPDLNLTAVTRVNNIDITLALNGTPATLTPKLTSDDPSLTQTDLISLLVTGRTDAERAAAGDYGGSELIGYLSADLVGAAGRAVGLDTLRVEQGNPDVRFDAGLVATETDPGARLTFGKNIGTRTQVVISQSLRNDGGTTWIVTYSPRSRIELRAVSLDDGDRLYGFRHGLVFGDPAPVVRAPAREVPRVTSVQITGAGSDETALRERLSLHGGDRFSFFRWQDDRDRLEQFYEQHDHATARVTTRRVESEASGSKGVAILYDVRPGPRTVVVVEGASFPDRLVQAMTLAWTRAVVDEFLFEEIVGLVKGEMLERGFVHASATVRLEGGADAKTLRVTVDPGPHVNARRVVFRGNERVASQRLQAVLADPALTRAVWLDPGAADDALTAFYRREGYLNATVALDEIAVAGNEATRVVNVNEGAPFLVRDVRIDGARGVPADDVRKMAALSSGTAYSDAAIEKARRAIVDGYRARGFNDVGLTVRTEAAEGRTDVDVAVVVDEGSQQRLRDVAIAGLMRTNPDLVRRALKLEAGEPVNLAAWAAARQRLYETGAFRSVDVQPEPMPVAAEPAAATPAFPTEQPIRAKVTLAEWPAVRLQYGLELDDQANTPSTEATRLAGSSSGSGRIFGLGVASDIGVRNLFGRAISMGLAGRYTNDFQAARAYVTAPTMFGRRIVTNGFIAFSREQVGQGVEGGNAKFGTNTIDLTLEQRWRPARKTEVTYRYTYERNHTFDLEPDPFDPLPFDVLATVARLASTLLVDTRNDLVDATRGWLHTSDFEYGVPQLGSDVRFVKYVLQQRYYRRVGPVVVATAGRVGLATAFEQTLLPSERFFTGGGNSVRGYDEDALSPQDSFGSTVGGNALLVLNEEVRFPIYKWARGVGFFDAGRAFETVSSMRLGGLPTSTGVGLRLQTPIVLVRVDVGVPLDSAFGPRRARWFFSIGQMF